MGGPTFSHIGRDRAAAYSCTVRRAHVLMLGLAFAAGACIGTPDGPAVSRSEPLRDLSSVEQAFLDLLNAHRMDNGAPEVMAERALNEGALSYSQRMGNEGFFDHVAPDGSTFGPRMCDAGYEPACGPSTIIGENIAAGQRTAREVFDAWRMSPGHNANMLDERYRVVGIGRATVSGSRLTYYWTNTFGGEVTPESIPNDLPPGSDAGGGTRDGGLDPTDGGAPPPRSRRDGGCSAVAGAPSGLGPELLLLLGLGLGGGIVTHRRPC